jgi:hypothetical protein
MKYTTIFCQYALTNKNTIQPNASVPATGNEQVVSGEDVVVQ